MNLWPEPGAPEQPVAKGYAAWRRARPPARWAVISPLRAMKMRFTDEV